MVYGQLLTDGWLGEKRIFVASADILFRHCSWLLMYITSNARYDENYWLPCGF